MKKTIVALLLLVCMVVALLPTVALADNGNTAKIMILGSQELTVTQGGAPAYLKNKEFDAFANAEGTATFKGWTQEPGDANNWNVKFEWPANGTPTVTLKDAKFDYFDNATETYAYIKTASGNLVSTANRSTSDIESSKGSYANPLISAIMPVAGYHFDLKVVLQGDNWVETGSGFVFGDLAVKENAFEEASGALKDYYFQNLTFTSVDGGKVVANGGGIGIHAKAGYDVYFDNAFVEVNNTVSGSNAIPIHVTNGNITIVGGHIKATNTKNCAMWITGTEGGDISINGDVTVSHSCTSTSSASSIYAKVGTIMIAGGNVTGTSGNSPVLNAGTAVLITGGNVKITTPYYGIYTGADALLRITGGTVEIEAKNAMWKKPDLGENMTGVAGLSADDAEEWGDKSYYRPWVKLSDNPTVLPSVAPTTKPTTQPTTKPTTPASKPTSPVIVPTTKPTTQPTTQPTDQSTAPSTPAETNSDGSSDTVLLIVAAGVIVVAAAAAAVIIIKRKKA